MRYVLACSVVCLAAASGTAMAQDDDPVGFGFPEPPQVRQFAPEPAQERQFEPELPVRSDPQQRLIAPPPQDRPISATSESPSTSFEQWLYTQEQKKLEDPRYLVYLRAAQKAEQRNRRLATTKWFGYSNTRPVANGVPLMGTYSPTWVGNSGNPFYWTGVAQTPVASINFGGVVPRR